MTGWLGAVSQHLVGTDGKTIESWNTE